MQRVFCIVACVTVSYLKIADTSDIMNKHIDYEIIHAEKALMLPVQEKKKLASLAKCHT